MSSTALPQKSELKPTAPKARNRKARGKRGARRPWTRRIKLESTESAKYLAVKPSYYALSELRNGARVDQGRRAPRLPLAFIFRAFGAVRLANQTLGAKPSSTCRMLRGDRQRSGSAVIPARRND